MNNVNKSTECKVSGGIDWSGNQKLSSKDGGREKCQNKCWVLKVELQKCRSSEA